MQSITPWASLPWFTCSASCLLHFIWPDCNRGTLAGCDYLSCCYHSWYVHKFCVFTWSAFQFDGTKLISFFIFLDWNMGACLYGFQLLESRVGALFVAGTSRVFLICFGVHYWLTPHFNICQVNLI